METNNKKQDKEKEIERDREKKNVDEEELCFSSAPGVWAFGYGYWLPL